MIGHKTYKPHLSTAGDARAVRTRQALREAMLALLETKGFDQITIGDVAEAAAVGYSTVCRHYPTLQKLLDDVAATEVARIINQTFPAFDPKDPSAASIALFQHVHEHRAVWTTLLTGGGAQACRAEFIALTRRLARAWKQPEAWLPSDLGAVMTASGTIELLAWWLQQDKPMSVEKIAGIFQRLLVSPLLPGVADAGAKAVSAAPSASRGRARR